MNDTITQQPDSLLPFYQWHTAYPMPNVDTCTGVPLDSIFKPYSADSVTVRPTLFTGHTLAPQHSEPTARQEVAAPWWVFAVAVLLCALLCLFYRTRKINIGELLKSTIDSHGAERLLRSLSLRSASSLVPVALILTAALALTAWNVAMLHTGLKGYLLLAAALAAGYMLRNGVLMLLASVFDRKQAMAAYISGNYLFHLLLATAVTPLLFVVVYIPAVSNAAVWAIGVLTALVFILRFFRGVQLFLTKTKSFSLFLFYYLCTVEMIPPLVLLKWFIS